MLCALVIARLIAILSYWFTVTVIIAKGVYYMLAPHIFADRVPVVYFPAT